MHRAAYIIGSLFKKTDWFCFVQHYGKHGSRKGSYKSRYQKDGTLHGIFKVLLHRYLSDGRIVEFCINFFNKYLSICRKSSGCSNGFVTISESSIATYRDIHVHLHNGAFSNFCMQI